MKKAISILAACMLVFSFAGMASAQDIPPAGECVSAGKIDRGCETPGTEQGGEETCITETFDYEDFGHCNVDDSYCDKPTKGIHRAFIPVCDCIANVSDFDEPVEGDTYDVFMEILVDKGDGLEDGDNGVYFAEDVNFNDWEGVGVEPMASESCPQQPDSCTPLYAFEGDFDYLYESADGWTTGSVYTGPNCEVPESSNRVTRLEPDIEGRGDTGFGYTITEDDVDDGLSTWWVDIPEMRADTYVAERGWKVYVKVSIQKAELTGEGGLCSDCPKCEHLVEIGTLCCDETVETCSDTLIFPYFPKTTNFWYGMAITNLGSEDGTASITMYENDGDMASGDVDVPANSSVVLGHQDVFDTLTVDDSPDGTLGNSQSYFKVVTDFPASGFGMTADNSDGSNSMGYLPVEVEDCSDCYMCGDPHEN